MLTVLNGNRLRVAHCISTLRPFYNSAGSNVKIAPLLHVLAFLFFNGRILGNVFCVVYNSVGEHCYSLQGYRTDNEGNFFEIINPQRIGRYANENIYISCDDNENKNT